MVNRFKHFYVNKYLVSPFAEKKYFLSYDFKHKAIWFRNYKVATRTIDKKLRENTSRMQYIYSSQVGYLPSRYKNYFKFAFVRNPIERFFSAWKNKVIDENYFKFSENQHQKMKEIENFVTWVETKDISSCDEHLMEQSSLIDISHIDFIGRFESFSEDFSYVLNQLGINNNEIDHINKSSKQQLDFSEEIISRVARIYEKDIRVFYPNLIHYLK